MNKKKQKKNNKEIILPTIKLKYFIAPEHGEDNFICSGCHKKSDKMCSGNKFTNEIYCEKCSIKNYARFENIKSLKVAEARRRRLFDVGYLFQEKVMDKILQEEKKKYDNLSEEEHQSVTNLAIEMWTDEKLFSLEDKIWLEETYDQKEIEEFLDEVIDSVTLHRVEID